MVCNEEITNEETGLAKRLEDPDSLTMLDECRRDLLEAGADPTIGTPSFNSLAMAMLGSSRKVVGDVSNSSHYSDFDQESLDILLNHGFELLASEMDLRGIVAYCIRRGGWTLDGVDFLLRLSGSKLPIQDLSCTLEYAIHGSSRADEREMVQVLMLLIENGANMTRLGHWVSEVACNPLTLYRTSDSLSKEMYYLFDGLRPNHDLWLRQIWAEALATCGYDPENFISQSRCIEILSEIDEVGSEVLVILLQYGEFISTSEYFSRAKRFDELSKIYNKRSKYQSNTTLEEDNISTAGYISEKLEDDGGNVSNEDGISTTENQASLPQLNEEAFDGEDASKTNKTYHPPVPTFYDSTDWGRLEEDARIWQD